MRNFPEKSFGENQKHILFSVNFLKNVMVCEICGKIL
jgi:hypothetical protein